MIIRTINFAKGRSTSYKLATAGGAVGAVGIVGAVGYKLALAGEMRVQATSLYQRKNSDNLGESRRR